MALETQSSLVLPPATGAFEMEDTGGSAPLAIQATTAPSSPAIAGASKSHHAAPHGSAASPGGTSMAPLSATPAPLPAKPPPNCTPPYVIDSQGHRQYKPECLE